MLASLPDADQVRERSCGCPGSGGFLLCSASEVAGTELLDGVMGHSMAWRLGVETTSPGQRCQIGCVHRAGEPCGAPLDSKGYHAATCKFGGYQTIRHSRIVHQLRGILRESGAIVAPREMEVAAWTRQDGTRARLDVSFVADGLRDYVDVTVRHPLAAKYLRRAATTDGAASATAEAAKRVRYPALAAAGLRSVVPFAVEFFGRLGPSGAHYDCFDRPQLAQWSAMLVFVDGPRTRLPSDGSRS